MLGRIYTFVLGMLLGAGMYHLALHFHVVRASDGVHLVAKSPPQLAETYVDIRTFAFSDWGNHPALALALTKAGKQNLMSQAVGNSVQQGVDQLLAPPAAGQP